MIAGQNGRYWLIQMPLRAMIRFCSNSPGSAGGAFHRRIWRKVSAWNKKPYSSAEFGNWSNAKQTITAASIAQAVIDTSTPRRESSGLSNTSSPHTRANRQPSNMTAPPTQTPMLPRMSVCGPNQSFARAVTVTPDSTRDDNDNSKAHSMKLRLPPVDGPERQPGMGFGCANSLSCVIRSSMCSTPVPRCRQPCRTSAPGAAPAVGLQPAARRPRANRGCARSTRCSIPIVCRPQAAGA